MWTGHLLVIRLDMIKVLRCRGANLRAAKAARLACSCTKTQQQIFDNKVDEFKAELPQHIIDRLERVAVSASLSPGERVLDVGSGVSLQIG